MNRPATNGALGDQLREATEGMHFRLPPAADVRRRGRQRRRQVALTRAAAGLVGLVGVVALGVGLRGADTDRIVPPTGPTPAPSSSFEPTPLPTSTPTSPVPVPTPSAPGSVSATTLEGFRFAEESQWRADAETTVERSDDLRRPWVLDPCNPTAYPTDAQRVAMRTVSRTGPEYFDARQLAVYADEAAATEALRGFRRVLSGCATSSGGMFTSTWRSQPLTAGDEGLLVWLRMDGPGGSDVVIVRDGRSVVMATASGDFSPDARPDTDGRLQQVVMRVLPLPQ